MRSMMVFAKRNRKEMVRDPLNLSFGIGFPIILLLLLSAINANIPQEAAQANLFSVDKLTPGIAVFGLSFLSLFSGVLIAKDKSTSYLIRLFTSPMKAKDFILGYVIPCIPLAIAQNIVCLIVAICLGLTVTWNVLLLVVVLFPSCVLYIAIGLLCGAALSDKQIGGVCGALLTNLSAWLSGTWFDVKLVGGGFEAFANLLPFVHAVDAGRYALNGEYSKIMPELWWVIGYAIVIMALAVYVFSRKMKNGKVS